MSVPPIDEAFFNNLLKRMIASDEMFPRPLYGRYTAWAVPWGETGLTGGWSFPDIAFPGRSQGTGR